MIEQDLLKSAMDRRTMNKGYWNIVIFAVVTAASGFIGAFINSLMQPVDPMQSPGILIWLIAPFVTNLLLRSLGKDGWKDFGLRLHIRTSWKWYLAAILIVPAISLINSGLSVLFGAATIPGLANDSIKVFLSLFIFGLTGSMVKNFFEEFSWRGYLTPQLHSLKANALTNSLITGMIWASWHIPYYLYFLNPSELQKQTTMGVTGIIISSFFLLPFQAFAYGELRLLTRSVWPAWLLHTIANAVSYALIAGGFIILSRDLRSIILTPGTEGILYSVLMGAIGFLLYRRRIRKEA